MIEGKYRHRFHIQPPQGWMNDPNGSCYYNGKYHIFFQYSPNSPLGSGGRFWGHYVSDDLAHFTFVDTPIVTDTEWDSDGAYSGTAYTDDGVMEIYYTGNVKHPGNFDYINEGRGHNVIRVDFEDGIGPGEKQLLLTNDDYPADLSCHVRDPKVWKKDDAYHMLLGMRSRASKGGLLLMKSADRVRWFPVREIYPKDDFGFMLECPDYFTADGVQAVAFCPQGMMHHKNRFQNVYESGYCILDDSKRKPYQALIASEDKQQRTSDILFDGLENTDSDVLDELISIDNFHEWDMGFDFYAPQTFTAPDGRQILIGWAGVPDAEYGNDPAIVEGWQHSLTLPRAIKYKNGRFYTTPAKEFESRRGKKIVDFIQEERSTTEAISGNGFECDLETGAWDVEMSMDAADDGLLFMLNNDVQLLVKDGIVSLIFSGNKGCGRTERHAELMDGRVSNVRAIFDRSLLEIYINDGEVVFTTRYYPDNPDMIHFRTECTDSAAGWLII